MKGSGNKSTDISPPNLLTDQQLSRLAEPQRHSPNTTTFLFSLSREEKLAAQRKSISQRHGRRSNSVTKSAHKMQTPTDMIKTPNEYGNNIQYAQDAQKAFKKAVTNHMPDLNKTDSGRKICNILDIYIGSIAEVPKNHTHIHDFLEKVNSPETFKSGVVELAKKIGNQRDITPLMTDHLNTIGQSSPNLAPGTGFISR